MRLFLYVLASAALGAAIVYLQIATGPVQALRVLGNLAFCAGIMLLIATSKSNPLESPRSIFFAAPAFLLAATALAIAGMALLDWSEPIGVTMMAFLALGYAPPRGPDAPFFVAMPTWLLSNFLLVVIGVAGGAVLRGWRAKPED